MKFDHMEDEDFFKRTLCGIDENLQAYLVLFDARPLQTKRREFNKQRRDLLAELVRRQGGTCQICRENGASEIDHIIPLSSNKLNKARNVAAPIGKKVPSQSLGSNDRGNLALVCKKCNGAKKHRLEPEIIKRLVFSNSVKNA